jgi:hypothetical protein
MCGLLVAAAASPALAVELRPAMGFVELAAAEHRTVSFSAGVGWPWDWKRDWAGGEWTGTTEAFVSHWISGAMSGGRNRSTMVAIVPLVRWRFDGGRSPWFVEGGIGASVMDTRYRTPAKEFSTSFNFYDVLALGHSFGSERNVELTLRLTHLSNASIKRPNPGENFLQVRYAWKF